MKKFIFFLVTIITSLTISAQPPAGMQGAPRPGQAIPNIGRIYGKLVDSNGKAVRDASVMLLHRKMDTTTKQMKQVLLKGIASQGNGDFNFEELPVIGQLVLNISATGYAPISDTISFMGQRPGGAKPGAAPSGAGSAPGPGAGPMSGGFEKDLGRLTLKTHVQQLQDVVVTASSSRLRLDIDKKVFNVDQNIVSAGGTAVDVMKNVPSVNVDIDGNVTLRNASPQLYVDGRPTTLTLDQIPADAIESVEVITNPSAKFDASGGGAGILNIVLKKNKKKGYNGNINAGIDKRGGINGGASLSVRQDKFNFSVSSFVNQMRNRNTGSTEIRNLLTTPNLLVNQTSQDRMKGAFVFGKVGVDYYATNRTTISLGAVKVHGIFDPTGFLRTDSAYEGGDYVSFSERNTSNSREFNATGLQGGFKYLFPKKGEELTADVNYFAGKSNSSALYNTDIFSDNGGAKTGNIQQQIIGSGTNGFLTMQTDYVTVFGASAKLEAGARVQLNKLTNNQSNYFYNAATGQFVLIPSATSNYQNKDNVYAGYLSFANSIRNFGYKVGLRAESSDYVGELTDTKEEFTNKYPISLFPSVFLSQKLKNQQELQLSVTRRVNRPFFMQLIPFIDSTDQLNWRKGNAALKPEFTNSIEASYSKTFAGNNTILVSAYYKRTTDLITRYIDTISLASGGQRPITTYINANSGRTTGMEFTSQNTLTKWWDLTSNLNVYNSKINTDNITGTSQDAIWSWFGKVNNSFKIPSNFKLQLSGTYQSKTNLPVNQNTGGGPGGGGPPGGGAQSSSQGYVRANFGVDAALQKSFLKNNAASVTFSVSDIFGTRKFDQYSESAFFIQNTYRRNDVPMFRLNFAFRFGQIDMNLFKRKNMKSEEGAQGAMQGIGS
jgi:ferric enterobactin receptor